MKTIRFYLNLCTIVLMTDGSFFKEVPVKDQNYD